MLENERISFKTVRKINEQHVPKRTSTETCGICCCMCQIFWAQSMAARLVDLKDSGDVHHEAGKATPSIPVKCPGMHCCYSAARLQMYRHALCLLCCQTHWSPGRY